jgi:hypothetical protein
MAVPLPRSVPDADRGVIYEFAMDKSVHDSFDPDYHGLFARERLDPVGMSDYSAHAVSAALAVARL